jgi:hypothetical protein
MEVKTFRNGIFLVSGAKCSKCGAEAFRTENGFDPSNYEFEPTPLQQHEGVASVQ